MHRHTARGVALLCLLAVLCASARALWQPSSPAAPLPLGTVLISNATLNPVAVYECAASVGSKRIPGALAYEGQWRCVFYNASAPNGVSWTGPGRYDVYVDTFGHAKPVAATAQAPFPPGTITPLITPTGYEYATGCQTELGLVLGGFPTYFPAYGTALPGVDGNFYCFGGSWYLYPDGRFTKGSLPYNIAIDTF